MIGFCFEFPNKGDWDQVNYVPPVADRGFLCSFEVKFDVGVSTGCREVEEDFGVVDSMLYLWFTDFLIYRVRVNNYGGSDV